ncbi:MAG: maleylacetoacetate isomerase [Burkholderiaceae bacterium]|jgi:maleylacetoacetate isomerase/maleylpyruvate isomerase|nr:MAG: maleylacetoacetate isomerase [Burkholderiaceae bacterium]
MKLYNYFRSSTSFRVRIALAFKGLRYEYVPVHLRKSEQRAAPYLARNPEGLVPLLELDDGHALTQSVAIMEYLDETYPQPALLPADALGRARVRALAQIIACEIHPLDNLRVLRYLVHTLNVSEDQKMAWYRHWVRAGLEAYERHLAEQPAKFSHGDAPTIADCCLVPQVFNAQRFDCDMTGLDRVMRVFDACMELKPFQDAQPSACPDAE